jgi:hypothetical protein
LVSMCGATTFHRRCSWAMPVPYGGVCAGRVLSGRATHWLPCILPPWHSTTRLRSPNCADTYMHRGAVRAVVLCYISQCAASNAFIWLGRRHEQSAAASWQVACLLASRCMLEALPGRGCLFLEACLLAVACIGAFYVACLCFS